MDGKWRGRILARLHARRLMRMTDLLDQLPGVPYLEVADRLGNDVAALHVIWMQFTEADCDAKLRRAAMDSLSRDIRQHLPDGWRQGSRGDFQTASAFADWAVRLCQHRAELRTKGSVQVRALLVSVACRRTPFVVDCLDAEIGLLL